MLRDPGRPDPSPSNGGGLSGARAPRPGEQGIPGKTPGGRLNLLLSSTDWREETWADHLPRLLQPMGVHAVRVRSGREAGDVLRHKRIDIAVVDLSLPLDDSGTQTNDAGACPEGGLRLLELLARAETPPPTLVVKRRRARRDDAREIAHALRAGAFAVIDRPVRLELVLQAMQRVLKKHYGNQWPNCSHG